MSVGQEIADFVVADLNDEFESDFTSERGYAPTFSAEAQGIRVIVAHSGTEITRIARISRNFFDVSVSVFYQAHITNKTNVEEIDDHADYVEGILDFLRNRELNDVNAANIRFLSISHPSPYDPKALNELSVFASVITVVYRIER